LTQIPLGPSSSASVLATIARPGRSPLDTASPGIGARTLDERTKAMAPPSCSASPSCRHSRTAPRKTDPKDRVQSSSETPVTGPVGGPPDADQGAVESTPALVGGAQQTGRRAGVRVVGHHAQAAVPERDRGVVEPALRVAGDHDVGSIVHKHLGGGAAETGTAAGDEVDAIGQSEIHAWRRQRAGTSKASGRNWVR
jgi:hypothetical protein